MSTPIVRRTDSERGLLLLGMETALSLVEEHGLGHARAVLAFLVRNDPVEAPQAVQDGGAP